MNIIFISTSASGESLSRRLIPVLRTELQALGAIVEIHDIRDFPPLWVDDRGIEDYPEPYRVLFESVKKCDGVVFIFPIYCYTYSSATKAISEIIGDALERKPVAFACAAGSQRSHLAVGHLMSSMAYEQDTYCYPNFLLVDKSLLANDAFDGATIERAKSMVVGFADFCSRLKIVEV